MYGRTEFSVQSGGTLLPRHCSILVFFAETPLSFQAQLYPDIFAVIPHYSLVTRDHARNYLKHKCRIPYPCLEPQIPSLLSYPSAPKRFWNIIRSWREACDHYWISSSYKKTRGRYNIKYKHKDLRDLKRIPDFGASKRDSYSTLC